MASLACLPPLCAACLSGVVGEGLGEYHSPSPAIVHAILLMSCRSLMHLLTSSGLASSPTPVLEAPQAMVIPGCALFKLFIIIIARPPSHRQSNWGLLPPRLYRLCTVHDVHGPRRGDIEWMARLLNRTNHVVIQTLKKETDAQFNAHISDTTSPSTP